MLWFVGLGIEGCKGLGARAVEVLSGADAVYFERYTSPLPADETGALHDLLKKEVKVVPRWFIEDGREILNAARSADVALVVYGDPLIATTHLELRIRAEREGIATRVLHAPSAVTSIIGECGLQMYKVGRIITLVSEEKAAANVYHTIYGNLLAGNHTLVLLEYDQEKNFFLDPKDAFRMLLESENDQKHGVISEDVFAVVASRIGSTDQKIAAGRIGSLLELDFGAPPHSIIITGSLHFTEIDALKALSSVMLDEPFDNPKQITTIAGQMIHKYVPKARKALEQARQLVSDDPSFADIFENAEYYISDAERFLNQGKPELAVLSIGYAEGLIDTIRFLKGVNVWE